MTTTDGSSEFYEYDDATNTFIPKANLPLPSNITNQSFSIGTKGYIVTLGTMDAVSKLYEYNSITDVWTQKSCPYGLSGAVPLSDGVNGYLLGGAIYPIGHGNGPVFWSTILKYNPVTDAWSTFNFLNWKSSNATGFLYNNSFYYGVGFWQYSSGGAGTDYTSDNAFMKSDFPVGLRENELPERYSVYPNPFTDKIKIDADEIKSATITDVTGRVVFESNEKEINVDFLQAGVYILNVDGRIQKIIKQ